jgi:hypothetical protein
MARSFTLQKPGMGLGVGRVIVTQGSVLLGGMPGLFIERIAGAVVR